MFKKYYDMIKKYFSLGANSKKYLFRLFLSAILRSLSFLLIPFMAAKIVEYATASNYEIAGVYVIIFLICSLFYVLCKHYNFVSYKNNAIFTHNKLQERIMNKVAFYDEDFSKKISTSYIINTAFDDVGDVILVPDLLFDTITEFIGVIITLFILIKTNIYIGIISFFLNCLALYVLDKNVKKKNYYWTIQKKYQDHISNLMGQVLDGNKEIKSFNMEEDIGCYLEKERNYWRKNYFLRRKYNDNIYVFVPSILMFGKLLIYFILIYFILHDKYDISILVLVIGYYESIESRFHYFYNCLDNLSTRFVCINRIYNILNYKNKNMLAFGDNQTDEISGKIEFKNVFFTYENQLILKNVSFEISPHSFTAIVGKSGSGKSTIFRLLLRLYKADKGSILLDEEDIYKYSKEVYASNVSIVTQKPFIFDMSIRENLSLVDSNKFNQIEACKRVGIHDFIMSLKDNYHTKLISNAENISVGEKQLLSFARTLLSKSEVLLFDEVTSSLDINTSKKVIEILKDLKKDHTILMITHKPELMKSADDILVIDHGKIVGRGKHSELIKNNIYYQKLHK